MLHKSFNPAKCKTSLKLATARIKLLRNRRQSQVKALRRDVAQLLETDQIETAMIRVEHVTKEAKSMAAYDLVEIFCEQIATNLNVIDSQKICPIALKESIASVIFASPRCSDVPELLEVKKQLTRKYGKDFVTAILELRPESGVSRKLVENLSPKTQDGPSKVKVLSGIAEEHNIKWTYEAFDEANDPPSRTILDAQRKFPLQHVTNYDALPSNAAVNEPASVMSNDASSSKLDRDSEMERRNRESRNDSLQPGKQGWNREFKTAADAAQAAAESAELASMAARAAAELSRKQSLDNSSSDKQKVGNAAASVLDERTLTKDVESRFSPEKHENKELISDDEMIARFSRLKQLNQSSNTSIGGSADEGGPFHADKSVVNSGGKVHVYVDASFDHSGVDEHSADASSSRGKQKVLDDFSKMGESSTSVSSIFTIPDSVRFDRDDHAEGDENPFAADAKQLQEEGKKSLDGVSDHDYEHSPLPETIFASSEGEQKTSYDDRYRQTDEPVFDDPESGEDNLFAYLFNKRTSYDVVDAPDAMHSSLSSATDKTFMFTDKPSLEGDHEIYEQLPVSFDESTSSSSEIDEEILETSDERKQAPPDSDEIYARPKADHPETSQSWLEKRQIEANSSIENEKETESWFDNGKLSGGFRNKGSARPLSRKAKESLQTFDPSDVNVDELFNKEVELRLDSSDDEMDEHNQKLPEVSRGKTFFDSDDSDEVEATSKQTSTSNNRFKGAQSRRTMASEKNSPVGRKFTWESEGLEGTIISEKRYYGSQEKDYARVRQNSAPGKQILQDEFTESPSDQSFVEKKPQETHEQRISSNSPRKKSPTSEQKLPDESNKSSSRQSLAQKSSHDALERRFPRVSPENYLTNSPAGEHKLPDESSKSSSRQSLPEKTFQDAQERRFSRVTQDTKISRNFITGEQSLLDESHKSSSRPSLPEKLSADMVEDRHPRVSPATIGPKNSTSAKQRLVKPVADETEITLKFKNSSKSSSGVEIAEGSSSGTPAISDPPTEPSPSPSPQSKVLTKENSMQRARHVHPKLPEYDDFANFMRQHRNRE